MGKMICAFDEYFFFDEFFVLLVFGEFFECFGRVVDGRLRFNGLRQHRRLDAAYSIPT